MIRLRTGRLRQDGSARREPRPRLRLRGRRHRRSRRRRTGSTRSLAAVDVAVDFSTPPRSRATCRAGPAGINIVLGTTGWGPHEAALRRSSGGRHRRRRGAEFLDRRGVVRGVAAYAAKLFAPQQDSARSFTRRTIAAKKDAPSGTALLLKPRWSGPATRGRSTSLDPRRLRSRHAHGRLRRPGRDHHADAHRARSRRLRARRPAAARWVRGRRGWFTMRDVLGLLR